MANVPGLTELQNWLLAHGRTLLDRWVPDGLAGSQGAALQEQDVIKRMVPNLTLAQRTVLDQQLQWRWRSRDRFPDPGRWLWTERSLSQASDWTSAVFKASLFPMQEKVLDACCGAGVDSTALAGRGPVDAADIDPWMVALAHSNAAAHGSSIRGFVENVERISLRDVRWLHADPDRRMVRGRTLVGERFSPALSALLEISRNLKGAVIKIAPSTRLDPKCENILRQGWVRLWIGTGNQCRQQLLITGEGILDTLRLKLRTDDPNLGGHAEPKVGAILLRKFTELHQTPEASYFSTELSNSFSRGDPGWPPGSDNRLGPYIYDLDPTLFASQLHGPWAAWHNLTPIHGEYGFYSASHLIATPWAATYELEQVLPWDDRHVRQWLKSYGAGSVEVKCRLVKMDANLFQRRYSRDGGPGVSLLVTRLGDKTRCLACRPVQANRPPTS